MFLPSHFKGKCSVMLSSHSWIGSCLQGLPKQTSVGTKHGQGRQLAWGSVIQEWFNKQIKSLEQEGVTLSLSLSLCLPLSPPLPPSPSLSLTSSPSSSSLSLSLPPPPLAEIHSWRFYGQQEQVRKKGWTLTDQQIYVLKDTHVYMMITFQSTCELVMEIIIIIILLSLS